jgi:predicted PurR-regulated permease PerM
MEPARATSVHPRTPFEPPRWNLLPWVALAALAATAWYFRGILMLVGAAVALAWVLSPAVDWLQARRVPRPFAILLVLLLVGVVTTGLLWVAVPDIVEHLTNLVGVIPQRMQQDWLPRITNGLLWLRRRSHLRIPVTTDAWVGQLASRASSVAQGSLAVVASAAGLSFVIVEKAIELLIVLALSFYTLSGWHTLLDTVRDLLPTRSRPRVLSVLHKVDLALGRLVRGQFVVMTILGTFFAVGLDALGLPAGFGLGIFAGLIAFVPYLGFLIALSIAALLAALDTSGHCSVGAIVGYMVAVHLLDILIVTPRVLGGSVGLSPVVIIVSLLAGAQAFGFVGLLVAVPIAAVVRVLLTELIDWYKSTRFYGLAPVHTLDTQSTVDTSLPAPRLSMPPGETRPPPTPPTGGEPPPYTL